MPLTKLGLYIDLVDIRNSDAKLGKEAVVGLSTQKKIIKTKANLSGVDLTSYKIFQPKAFAYVSDTSRRGERISLAYNMSKETYLVSSISIVFVVKDEDKIIPEYLFMFFNRSEFDRYSRFNSWGSAREIFSWEEMCDIDIEIPTLKIQRKYIDIYKAIIANLRSYKRGLDDLKLLCTIFIENLKKQIICEKIGPYLCESDKRNNINLGMDAVRGLTTGKAMIPTKANIMGISLSNYKMVQSGQIAYVPDTSRRGEKISIGFNDTDETFLVPPISIVFSTNLDKLLPEYLMLFLTRSEFDRYARFHSWGSVREIFSFEDMCNIEIPIPNLDIQQSILKIYKEYIYRKNNSEYLAYTNRNICSILIAGSLKI